MSSKLINQAEYRERMALLQNKATNKSLSGTSEDDIKNALKEVDDYTQSLEKRVTTLEKDSSAQAQADKVEKVKDDLQEGVKKAEAETQRLKEEIEKLKSENQKTIGTYDEKINALELELEGTKQKLEKVGGDGVEGASAELQQQIENLKQEKAKVESECKKKLQELQEELETVKGSLGKKESELNTATKELEDLKRNAAEKEEELNQKVTKLEQSLRDAPKAEALETLQGELKAAKKNLESAQSKHAEEIGAKEKAIEELKKEKTQQVEDLTGKLNVANDKQQEGEKKVKELETQVKDLEKQIAESSKEGDVASLKEELAAAKKKLEDVVANHTAELEGLKNAHATLLEKAKQIQVEVAGKTNQLNDQFQLLEKIKLMNPEQMRERKKVLDAKEEMTPFELFEQGMIDSYLTKIDEEVIAKVKEKEAEAKQLQQKLEQAEEEKAKAINVAKEAALRPIVAQLEDATAKLGEAKGVLQELEKKPQENKDQIASQKAVVEGLEKEVISLENLKEAFSEVNLTDALTKVAGYDRLQKLLQEAITIADVPGAKFEDQVSALSSRLELIKGLADQANAIYEELGGYSDNFNAYDAFQAYREEMETLLSLLEQATSVPVEIALQNRKEKAQAVLNELALIEKKKNTAEYNEDDDLEALKEQQKLASQIKVLKKYVEADDFDAQDELTELDVVLGFQEELLEKAQKGSRELMGKRPHVYDESENKKAQHQVSLLAHRVKLLRSIQKFGKAGDLHMDNSNELNNLRVVSEDNITMVTTDKGEKSNPGVMSWMASSAYSTVTGAPSLALGGLQALGELFVGSANEKKEEN